MNKVKASHWFAQQNTLPNDTVTDGDIFEKYFPRQEVSKIDNDKDDESGVGVFYAMVVGISLLFGPIGFIVGLLLIIVHFRAS